MPSSALAVACAWACALALLLVAAAARPAPEPAQHTQAQLGSQRQHEEGPAPAAAGAAGGDRPQRALVLAATGDVSQWPRLAVPAALHMQRWPERCSCHPPPLFPLSVNPALPPPGATRSWLADAPCGRAFDLGLIYYGANPNFTCPQCAFVRRARGAKWRLRHELLDEPGMLRRVGGARWRKRQLSRSVGACRFNWPVFCPCRFRSMMC